MTYHTYNNGAHGGGDQPSGVSGNGSLAHHGSRNGALHGGGDQPSGVSGHGSLARHGSSNGALHGGGVGSSGPSGNGSLAHHRSRDGALHDGGDQPSDGKSNAEGAACAEDREDKQAPFDAMKVRQLPIELGNSIVDGVYVV
eukprot:gene10763-17849_t